MFIYAIDLLPPSAGCHVLICILSCFSNSSQVEGKGKLAWNGEDIVLDESTRSTGAPAPSPIDRRPRLAATQAGPTTSSSHSTDSNRLSATDSKRSKPLSSVSEGAMDVNSASIQPDATFSWLGRRSQSAAGATRSDKKTDDSLALRNDSKTAESARRVYAFAQGPTTTSLGFQRTGTQDVNHRVHPLSSPEESARVAAALDRMGSGVVEVREAFQRWVPQSLRKEGVTSDAAGQGTGRRARVNPPTVARLSPTGGGRRQPDDGGVSNSDTDVERAMTNAMMELRVPEEIAQEICNGAGVTASAAGGVSFACFIERYAEAAGLLKETSGRSRGEVWAEGPGGLWVELPHKDLAGASAIFDEGAVEEEAETKSDHGGEYEGGNVGYLFLCTKPAYGSLYVRECRAHLRPAPISDFLYLDREGLLLSSVVKCIQGRQVRRNCS